MSYSKPFRLPTPHLLTAQQRCCGDTRAVSQSAPNQKHDTCLAETDRKLSFLPPTYRSLQLSLQCAMLSIILSPFVPQSLPSAQDGQDWNPWVCSPSKWKNPSSYECGFKNNFTHIYPALKTTKAINPAIFLFHCLISDNLQC